MSEHDLIAGVRAGDLQRVAALLAAGVDIEACDEHGWTPLCWAAGAGDAAIVQLLLDRGANVFAAGQDLRTPYLIAIAASRVDAARLLQQAEARTGDPRAADSSGQAARRPYCRAYRLAELRQFDSWRETPAADGAEPLLDDSLVFVHRDYRVTRSIWSDEGEVFDGASADWQSFCADRLGFAPPDDFDWLPSAS